MPVAVSTTKPRGGCHFRGFNIGLQYRQLRRLHGAIGRSGQVCIIARWLSGSVYSTDVFGNWRGNAHCSADPGKPPREEPKALARSTGAPVGRRRACRAHMANPARFDCCALRDCFTLGFSGALRCGSRGFCHQLIGIVWDIGTCDADLVQLAVAEMRQGRHHPRRLHGAHSCARF